MGDESGWQSRWPRAGLFDRQLDDVFRLDIFQRQANRTSLGLPSDALETSVDEVLTRELENACAHAEELAAAVPGFAEALAWPCFEG